MAQAADPTADPHVLKTSLQLFLCLFAAQSAILTLSPILPDIARDFDVSNAAVGQLRALSGLIAGVVAVVMATNPPRRSLRKTLLLGLGLLAAGSVISATAPSFQILFLAQLPMGLGLAVVLAGGLAAADRWAPEGGRARLLSWTLAGQPAAWIVGMPIVGSVGEINWRLSWVAVPLVASIAAASLLVGGSREEPCEPAVKLRDLLRDGPLVRWAISEMLAFSGWAGLLIYVGALFSSSYGSSVSITGLILGGIAIAYLPGNILVGRWMGSRARSFVLVLAPVLGVATAIFGIVRPSVAVSFAIMAVVAFIGGGRTIAASMAGLETGGEKKMAAMSLRTAAVQFGYLIGAAVGGVALRAGGYSALGIALGGSIVLSTVPLLWSASPKRSADSIA